ncbi:helix-turn-helix transcriptional regulator [Nocardioides sp. W7]|uniref:helix-turn-helix domain-containing protein n=1 Tax=Nocardioides sp. W7 TaxID=2931390 RepID=UPI001FD5EB40|nr:helix-turn-helix transcriptional regulator [Nocardioides sp. W7]
MPRRRSAPTWEEFAREIGHNLSRARAAKGLSQERVAHLAGITGFTYQKYEKGESRPGQPMNPQLRTLVALSQALEVPLVDLLPTPFPDVTGGG